MDCPHCKVFHEEAIFKDNLMVCPECGHHLRMEPRDRIAYLADEGSFKDDDGDCGLWHQPGR